MLGKIVAISDWLWSYPLVLLLSFGALYATLRLRFIQITKLPLIIKTIYRDSIKKNASGEGNISALQAGLTAIGSTLGAGNIMGVAVAISMGGTGALFWMLVVGTFAICLKYVEIILGIKYREKNELGEYVGGAMYYLKHSKIPIFGGLFAVLLAIELLPSIGLQALSVVQSAETLGISKYITGTVMFLVVLITVVGGVKRIGALMDKIVPFMSLAYFVLAWIVILYNYKNIPLVIGNIFAGAFSAPAAFGGLAGGTVAITIRSGLARGTYSNEAGMGTSPIAYAAAVTDFPARQALWGMLEVFISTFVMCFTSGLLVTTSGVYQKISADKAASMPAVAFQELYGTFLGGTFMTVIIILFVLSTLLAMVFFGEKQVEYICGTKISKLARYVYMLMILVGAFGSLGFTISILDITLALLVIINMLGVIMLTGDAVEESDRFFEHLKNNENS
ncbi:alanine/glycine:cation symporter family protein [Fusobacterium gastrosuis]|uniref:alanine/glycine:cation symporter family protein n=1 Tax=Fusobacterium gastrosuis TaxID=1755100 RepID=UPI0029723C19|nr:amino acid carrier protein [Fusobacteriaceae bacterium]MDY5712699.1 amino acid carrier protein [Fusobacterium gastrosuis]